MSRSGYVEECDDQWRQIRWRGAVNSAIKGKKGQAFLKEMLAALDALPEKKLIARELVEEGGAVCALGAVGKVRRIDMRDIDPEDSEKVAATFGVAEALAREIVYMNDDAYYHITPEERFARMREWVAEQILPVVGELTNLAPKNGD